MQGLAAAGVVVVAAVTVRSIVWEPPPIPPVPEVRAGVQCYRAGGDRDYCRCMDRLESARAEARLPPPALPALDDPAIRYALRHHELFPVITGDTPHCVRVPGTAPAGPAIGA
jgi:hypothetical protein